jgi:PadR family transcriptional regulator, regulatory protein PadR
MRSEPRDPQLLKGVLPMLVLSLLTERESYGYELVTRLQADGLSDIAAGTVYPVLTRLEREGLITSRLVASSSGPARKYYVPTALGAAELARSARSWLELTITVSATLGRASPEPDAAHTPHTPHTPHTQEETP